MLRFILPRLSQTSRCSSEDFVSQSLATFRQLVSESTTLQLRQGISCRGLARLPGSDPAPAASRPKRPGTRKGLPAGEQTSSETVAASDISADDHANNIATLQRESAATGAEPTIMTDVQMTILVASHDSSASENSCCFVMDSSYCG